MHGSVMSMVAAAFMGLLFIVELNVFMSSNLVTKVAMDNNMASQLRVNFNITVHDLHCASLRASRPLAARARAPSLVSSARPRAHGSRLARSRGLAGDFLEVNLYDAIGTKVMNVTPNVEKWQLDSDGVRRMYQGRNRRHYEIDTEDHHPELEVLHENGEHARPLDAESFDGFLKEHEFTFVDFYAPWCIWCQRLAPVWEVFAESIEQQGQPVDVMKVDCTANAALCAAQKVQAFPTLRFFHREEPVNQGDYRSDRTVENLLQFVQRKLDLENQYKEWPEARKVRATSPPRRAARARALTLARATPLSLSRAR